MLKSSKWAPWQPSEEYLDSLEQRAASSQVAGDSRVHEPGIRRSADLCLAQYHFCAPANASGPRNCKMHITLEVLPCLKP